MLNTQDERRRGTVVWFDAADKGYGFIGRDDGGDDVFMHANRIRGEYPRQGDRVSFTIRDGAKGPIADDVQVEPPASSPASPCLRATPRGSGQSGELAGNFS